jgi:hypothetical protein
MGGYVARLGQWQHFDTKWRRALARRGLTHIHTKDLLNGSGEFNGWNYDQGIKLTLDTEKIVARHTLFGFSTFVSDKDYREIYVAGEKPKKIPLDTRYGLCFRLVLSIVPKKIRDAMPRDDISLNLVLEDGAQNAGDAVRIFNLFKTEAPPELAKMAGTISFGKKKEFPGLQAADGIASSVFRLQKDPPDQPFYFPENVYDAPLSESRARMPGSAPVFRIEATPTVLRELRENIFAKIQARKQFGQRTRQTSGKLSDPS